MRLGGVVSLEGWRGRRVPLRMLEGPRPPPIAFGSSSPAPQALVEGMTGLEFQARVRLHVLEQAYVVMGWGDDGAVLTRDLDSVLETSAFTQLAHQPRPLELKQPLQPEVLENVVVGVDGASHNYYHWLLNALARSRLCADLVPGSTVLLPDWRTLEEGGGRVTPGVMQASAEAILGTRPRRLLSPGVYPVRGLHLLWTRPPSPTELSAIEDLYAVFDGVAADLAPAASAPHRRLYLSRRGAADERVPSADQAGLADLLGDYGFEWLDLARMSFEEQVRAAAEARIIVAPHGAGMTNLLFSPRKAVVIELVSHIDGEPGYRPWYYQLCSGRGQRYGALDVARPSWLADLRTAIRRCLSLRRST